MQHHRNLSRATLLICLLAALASAGVAQAAAVITIVNTDGAGEGLNDPTPAAPVGGNTGATLGDQRRIVFETAASIWAGLLDSSVEIRVETNFDPLFCNATSATLGSAGPNTAHRDFAGALAPSTWYPQALANRLAGVDLDPGQNDIGATFNADFGTTCAFPGSFYLGLDGADPPSTIDLLTVAIHEIGHGVGFLTLVNLSTGEKFLGDDDHYMVHLEDHATGQLYPTMTDAERITASKSLTDLHWTGPAAIAANACLSTGLDAGGHIEMYAPDPQEQGSSVSHWSTSLSPDALMEPFYVGPNHDPSYDAQLLTDTGWNSVAASCLPAAVPSSSRPSLWLLSLVLLGALIFAVSRRSR